MIHYKEVKVAGAIAAFVLISISLFLLFGKLVYVVVRLFT